MTAAELVAAAGYGIVDGRMVSLEGCEINVALNCNLTCRACTHLSPVAPKELIDPERVYADLSALSVAYRCQFVKLLGGEPFLHRDLAAVAEAARASGVADYILVCTNGVLLGRANERLWAAVDEIEVSIYPGREPDAQLLDAAARQASEHGVRLHLNWNSHFRESYSELGTADARLTAEVFRTCKMAHVWRCHTVHDGHFYRCPPSLFIPMVTGDRQPPPSDRVALHPSDGLFERLAAYLTSTTPLEACQRCLGSAGQRLEHSQVPRREWRRLQEHSTEDLLDREFLAVLTAEPDADDGCVSRRQVLVAGRQ